LADCGTANGAYVSLDGDNDETTPADDDYRLEI